MKKTLQQLEKEIDNPYWDRGKQYYREGLISDVVQKDSIIKAKCEGNSLYTLKIDLDKRIMDCSCPCDFSCKHLAALLFWLRKNNPLHINSLEKDFNTLSKKELIKTLKIILEKYPEANKYLRPIDKEELSSLIKKLWIPKYEYTNSFFNEIDYIKEQLWIVKDFTLIQQFLRKLIDMFDHHPDAYEIDSSISTFLEELEEKVSMTKKEKKELRQMLEEYPFEDYL